MIERTTKVASPEQSAGLVLTNQFRLTVSDRELSVPHTVERLLAFLALSDHTVPRTKLASMLWSEASERQAANSLRTALWRLGRRHGTRLVAVNADRVGLSADVVVDISSLTLLSRRLIRKAQLTDLDRVPQLVDCGELLPDWDEGWVVTDREQFRLIRLAALEAAARALMEQQRLGDALIAALAAIRTEPLRESSHRLAVQIHLREGNVAEALRQYYSYRGTLQSELGLQPSRYMQRLVEPLTGRDACRPQLRNHVGS